MDNQGNAFTGGVYEATIRYLNVEASQSLPPFPPPPPPNHIACWGMKSSLLMLLPSATASATSKPYCVLLDELGELWH